jgi:hypothetical protein
MFDTAFKTGDDKGPSDDIVSPFKHRTGMFAEPVASLSIDCPKLAQQAASVRHRSSQWLDKVLFLCLLTSQ